MTDTLLSGIDKTRLRKPSFRGRVMFDVVNGQIRVRKWPKKRGKKLAAHTLEQNDWFRQAQWATKYWDPRLMQDIADAVSGTPLLPRDIATMIMAGRFASITIPGHGTIYPMAAINDVTQSLDVVAQQRGNMLVRGPDLWMPLAAGPDGWLLTSRGELMEPHYAPPPAAKNDFVLIESRTISAPTQNADFLNLGSYGEILMIATGLTAAASSQRYIFASTDNGATFFTSSTEYGAISQVGAVTGAGSFGTAGSVGTAGYGMHFHLLNNQAHGQNKIALNPSTSAMTRMFLANGLPINALRVTNSTTANLTGGTIIVYAR